MDIILGLLIGILLTASYYWLYHFAYNKGLKAKTSKQKEIDEIAKRQMELRQEGLKNILSYNADVAMRRVEGE